VYSLTNTLPSELLLNSSLQPNVPVGQAAGNPGPSFQIAGQPPAWAWDEVRPNICARPDEQGIPGPLWQLVNVAVEQPGGDDLYVITHYKKSRPF
jgi:hypothetical protein